MSSVRGHKHFGMPTHTLARSQKRGHCGDRGHEWADSLSHVIAQCVCVCFSCKGKNNSLEMGTNAHMHTPRADCIA